MVRSEELQVKAGLPIGENPLPQFRTHVPGHPVALADDVPQKYRENLSADRSRLVLPYLKQDRYDRVREWTPLKTIILENKHLKATFLPSLGGRLASLYDKDGRRELLRDVKTPQTANLSDRDAWFAGGIEWVFGEHEHALTSCGDVYFSKVSGDHIRMYDYDRCDGLWWRVDFFLCEGERMLDAITTIENTRVDRQKLSFHTTMDVEQRQATRVFASSTHALFEDDDDTLGYMDGSVCPRFPKADASYPRQWTKPGHCYFTCEGQALPWIAAIQEDGNGFFEASSPALGYRGLFSWGNSASGANWQRFLSPGWEGEYAELQSRLTPTPFHDAFIEGNSSLSWMQSFGPVSIGKRTKTYPKERLVVEEAVGRSLTKQEFARRQALHAGESDEKDCGLLHRGDGWAYLEKEVWQDALDVTFHVEKADVPKRLLPWLQLVERHIVPPFDPLHIPPVTGDAWLRLLQASEGDPMTLAYYGGIMLAENGYDDQAIDSFQLVHQHMHDAVSARNIAKLLLRQGKDAQALLWYKEATYNIGFGDDPAITEEYVNLLFEHGSWPTAHALLSVLPAKWETGTIKAERAILACHENNKSLIVKLLKEGFDNLRPGDGMVDDVWVTLLYMSFAPHEKKTLQKTLGLLSEHPLPPSLSFSFQEKVAQERRIL